MTRLAELAKEVTSKNAGNFLLTVDLVFDDRATYDRVRFSGAIDKEAIAELYGIPVDAVVRVLDFEPGLALKVVMRRERVSGDPGDPDVFGAQQYAPFLDIEIPD